MNTAVIVTKIDPKIKEQAQVKANELGIPLSIIVKGFLKEFIRTKKITFSAADEEPSEYLKNAIRQADKDWKEGKGSPIFKTGEEAAAWLEKQGI